MNQRAIVGLTCVLSGCAGPPQDATVAGPAVAEVLVTPAQVVVDAGTEVLVQAQANDASGAPVGGATFGFESTSPDAIEISAPGVVRSVGPVVSAASIIVRSGGQERRVPVVVRPGPLQQLETVSGEGQKISAGEPLTEPPVVRATDRYGNPLAGVELEARIADQPLSSAPTHTDEQGLAPLKLSAPERAGRAHIEVAATAGSSASTSFDIDVMPARPARIEVIDKDAITAKEPGAEVPIPVRVSDRFGNAISGVSVQAEVGGRKIEAASPTDTRGTSEIEIPGVSSKRSRTLRVFVTADPTVSATTMLP